MKNYQLLLGGVSKAGREKRTRSSEGKPKDKVKYFVVKGASFKEEKAKSFPECFESATCQGIAF